MEVSDVRFLAAYQRADFVVYPAVPDRVLRQRQLPPRAYRIIVKRVEKSFVTVLFEQSILSAKYLILSPRLLIEVVEQEYLPSLVSCP